MPHTFPKLLIDKLKMSRHIVVFTGAGVSAESGIATFRDNLTGLWQQYDASELACANGFRKDPGLVWGWYEWRRMQVLKAQPNPAHIAIANLELLVEDLTLITQNVDDLHERAGSHDVIHLHGSIQSPRCFACARPYIFSSEIPEEPEGGRHLPPPRCAHCNGRIRPGVVWFGELLPQASWKKAETAVKNCDLFLSIGTSAFVNPAALLPELAAKRGTMVVQINPEVTALNSVASYHLSGKAGEILPLLLASAFDKFGD